MEEWQSKLTEFEKNGIWENVVKVKVPLFGVDDLPGETNAFVFKVKQNIMAD